MRSTEGSKELAGEVIVPLKIEFVEGSELPLEELIRKVVREELAAHGERLTGEPEVIAISDENKKALADYLKLNPTI
jgi:hypothetical protein